VHDEVVYPADSLSSASELVAVGAPAKPALDASAAEVPVSES
jgi:hypothetical protein